MIVVTGAAGFIGSVVVSALNAAGHEDLLLVDTLGSEGKFKNLRAKAYRDIIDPIAFLEALPEIAEEIDAIVHLGAITDTSAPDADAMLDSNTHYTQLLAQIALENDIRFIYASSASVYGDGALGFSDDDALTPSFKPLNPYAFSKWLFDAMAIRHGWTDKIVGLRFFNVFGPNEYHKARMASVIWHAYRQVQETGKIKLFQSHKAEYADGAQERDFIHVDDLSKVILFFLEHPEANGIFNLGTGKARSFNDLAAAIFQSLGKEPQIEYIPTPENIRNAYQYFTEADLTKLRAAGYDEEFLSLEEGVDRYIQGYLVKDDPYV
ncbi:ADP-L-glycero-D-manno-heptose-6-epimerase [Capsulimonas corticalis]|uniref:ADP-L-glycero-D-manno-heptose-6-epimerase n=1 Tax=Capsulimonas corticalis TaxID=2219043 RepID=A0A402CSJ5_9BACT|nr:ADP-glyceromanno-heptose 6-epimerase [Capsulimonas corticalis]BDI31058.1 ADP-L-glycero-D-manno-heptose-6-epimerase [Capsulimonas corticalis]